VINGNALPIPGWDGGDGNSAYLDKTLRHEPVETVLDDRVSGRTVFQLWARAAVVSFLTFVVFVIPGVISLLSDNPFEGSSGDVGTGGAAFFLLSAPWAGFLVFVIVLLLSKLTEPIAEWRVLLHDRDDTASAYSKIREVVAQRRFPFGWSDSWTASGPADRDVAMRLVLSQDDCTAHISVFRYGTSLYLGWQMWRTRSGARLIWQYLSDIVGSVTGRSGLQWAMQRTAKIRAMREAVHAACREGLIVAIEREQVPLSAGFPDGRLPQVEYQKTVPGTPPAPPAPVRIPAPPAAPPAPPAAPPVAPPQWPAPEKP